MKTRTSIYGRAFAYALLIAVIFCGCGNFPQPCGNDLKHEQQIKHESNWNGFEVIIVDSCEYLNKFYGDGHSGYRFTHKGNCKFCAERSKK